MGNYPARQAQIEGLRQDAAVRYPQLWANMIAGWKSGSAVDAAWLMYSANYLLRTGDIRWAIDPLSLHWRIPSAPKMDVRRDLDGLAFVLLTHAHKDHLDLDLIGALKDLPIVWVVPEFLAPLIQKGAGLKPIQMVIPRLLEPISLPGVTILPFESQHLITYPDGRVKGLPEIGYLVDCACGRLLFPGDIRVYDSRTFPKFDRVDVLFAHLWLGHGLAMQVQPGIVQAFCQFCADIHPGQVIITHLQELGRDASDFVGEEHVARVQQVFESEYPHLRTVPAFMGVRVALDL